MPGGSRPPAWHTSRIKVMGSRNPERAGAGFMGRERGTIERQGERRRDENRKGKTAHAKIDGGGGRPGIDGRRGKRRRAGADRLPGQGAKQRQDGEGQVLLLLVG